MPSDNGNLYEADVERPNVDISTDIYSSEEIWILEYLINLMMKNARLCWWYT